MEIYIKSVDAINREVRKLKQGGYIEAKVMKANGAPTRHFKINQQKFLEIMGEPVAAESPNGNGEIAKSEMAKSPEPRNGEIAKSLTDSNHTVTKHTNTRPT